MAIFSLILTDCSSRDGGGTFELLYSWSRRGARCGREERSAKNLVDILVIGIIVVVFDVAIGVCCCCCC